MSDTPESAKGSLDAPQAVTSAEIVAFAQSIGFFGFDRRQTRRFLNRIAASIGQLEQEVSDSRAKEHAIGQSLIVAASTARSITDSATAQVAAREQEAAARIRKLEEESLSTRLRLVAQLRQCSTGLDELIAGLSPDEPAPEGASGEGQSTAGPTDRSLSQLHVGRNGA